MIEDTKKESLDNGHQNGNDSSLCGFAMIIHHSKRLHKLPPPENEYLLRPKTHERRTVQSVGVFDPAKPCEKPNLEVLDRNGRWNGTPEFNFSYDVGDTDKRNWKHQGEISRVVCAGLSQNSSMWLGMGTTKGNIWIHELTPEHQNYSWPKNEYSILSSKNSKDMITSLCFRQDVLFSGNIDDELLVWHLPRKKLVHRHSAGKNRGRECRGVQHIESLTKPNLLAYQAHKKVCIYDLRKRVVTKTLNSAILFPSSSQSLPVTTSYGIRSSSYWNDLKYDMESQLLYILLSEQHAVVLYDVRSGVVVKKLEDLRRNTIGCLSHLCLRKTQNELIVVENGCGAGRWKRDQMKKKENSSLPYCTCNYFHMLDLNTFKVLRRFHDISFTRTDQLYSIKGPIPRSLGRDFRYIEDPYGTYTNVSQYKQQHIYYQRWKKEKEEGKKNRNRGKKKTTRLKDGYDTWRYHWERNMAHMRHGKECHGPVLKIQDFPDQQNLFGSMYRDRVFVYSGETGKKKSVIGSGRVIRSGADQSIRGLCYIGPKMLSPLLCVGYETENKEFGERLEFVCSELANWEVSMLNKSVDVWKILLMLSRGEKKKEKSVMNDIGLDVSEESIFKLIFCTTRNYSAKAREKKKGRAGLERICHYFMFFGGIVAKNSSSAAERILHWSREMFFESIKSRNWEKDVVTTTFDQICKDVSRKELLLTLLKLEVGEKSKQEEDKDCQKVGKILYENFLEWLQIQTKTKTKKTKLKDDEKSSQKKQKQKDKNKTKKGKLEEKSRFSFVELLRQSRNETYNVLLRAKNEKDEWVEIPSHVEILCYKSNFWFCLLRFRGLEYEEFKEKGTITLEFMKSRLLLALLDFYYDPVGEIKTTDIATLLLMMEHGEIYQDSKLMKSVVIKIRQRVRNSTKQDVIQMLKNNRKMFENQKLLQLTMALFSREWIGISQEEFNAILLR